LLYAEHKDRFEKAGFDIYRDKQSEFVWRLEVDAESGQEFIIRTASIDPLYQIAPEWSAEVNAGKTAITLLYKGHAVRAFKKADLQFDEQNVEDWRRFLLDKISNDPSFLKQVVQDMGDQRRTLLASKCPELFK
jgi:flavin-dependent dehydrogenase